jgi:hypothetical protein
MRGRQAKGADPQKEYRRLKRRLLALGWSRPGSLIRRFMPCGHPACRCMGTPPQLHGPYYQWSHKVGGKTRSLRLSENQARLAKPWAQNYKTLKGLLRRMEQLALQETDRILGAIS